MVKSLLTLVLLAWISLCLAGSTYDDGQWHTTTAYAPSTTTYYQEYYPTTTYSTSTYIYTQAANVIVTVTSLIPCPVTSTLTIYQCAACPVTSSYYTPPTSTYTPNVVVGTTTVTSYTTTTLPTNTQAVVSVTSTITSNGNLVVVVGASVVPSVSITNDAGVSISVPSVREVGIGVGGESVNLSLIVAILACFVLLK